MRTPWVDPDRRERRWQLERLAALLHALARSLRSGATLHSAILHVAGDPSVAGVRFVRAAARVRDGASVEAEIDRWAAGLAHRDADMVRAVVNAGAATGSAVAAAFERAATSLQERADLQREIGALTAQARASAVLLTVAPVAFTALVAVLDPAVLVGALSSTAGVVAVVVGVALDLAGWVWMRHLTEAVDP